MNVLIDSLESSGFSLCQTTKSLDLKFTTLFPRLLLRAKWGAEKPTSAKRGFSRHGPLAWKDRDL